MKLAQYKIIAKEIDDAFAAILAKHNLKIGRRSASVDETMGQINYRCVLIDLALKTADGEATTPEAQRWRVFAAAYGLKAEWLGAKLRMNAKEFVIEGLKNTSSPKCVILSNGGKQYVSNVEQVTVYMNAQKAA